MSVVAIQRSYSMGIMKWFEDPDSVWEFRRIHVNKDQSGEVQCEIISTRDAAGKQDIKLESLCLRVECGNT